MSGSLKLAGLVLVSGILGGLAAIPHLGEPTRLTFLSVGQGDCAVFQTDGRTVLIDVGPKSLWSDGGRRIVVPDLRRMGIDTVDLVLLSHPDMDHIGGLGALLKGVKVGTVALSANFSHYEPLLTHLKEAGCAASQTVWLGPEQHAQIGDFTIDVDCPEWHEGEPDNDGSEFVKISGDRASATFTGDASSLAEIRMMPGHDWTAQVLKLGHHGSQTASSEAFLRAVHPAWGIVSCGRDNSYGHPHQIVLDRLQKLGIQVARTDREGDITFNLGANGWVRAR